MDRFQGHIFDIKHNKNTTVARHFHIHKDQLDPRKTIHILEHIQLPKNILRSNSLRGNRELVWIHRLHTLIPNGLKYFGLRQSIWEELKSINKGHPAFFANIIQSQGCFSMNVDIQHP